MVYHSGGSTVAGAEQSAYAFEEFDNFASAE